MSFADIDRFESVVRRRESSRTPWLSNSDFHWEKPRWESSGSGKCLQATAQRVHPTGNLSMLSFRAFSMGDQMNSVVPREVLFRRRVLFMLRQFCWVVLGRRWVSHHASSVIVLWASVATLCPLLCWQSARAAEPAAVEKNTDEVVVQAATAYAEAFNKRDYTALADQWTSGATLVEGDARLEGREAILGSLQGWLSRHPQAMLQIRITGVQFVATTLVRMKGVLVFTRKVGEKPLESRFESLRVLEDGEWRLAESKVLTNHAAALEDFEWLTGTWNATDPKSGASIETIYEKAVNGYAILGRTKIKSKAGNAFEAIDVIHADRDTGVIHSWIFDSTGARAEGFLESNGTTFNRTLVGTPADSVEGRHAEWVQVIAPTGDGRFTMQSIERTLDGVSLPDGEPLHFRRIR